MLPFTLSWGPWGKKGWGEEEIIVTLAGYCTKNQQNNQQTHRLSNMISTVRQIFKKPGITQDSKWESLASIWTIQHIVRHKLKIFSMKDMQSNNKTLLKKLGSFSLQLAGSQIQIFCMIHCKHRIKLYK